MPDAEEFAVPAGRARKPKSSMQPGAVCCAAGAGIRGVSRHVPHRRLEMANRSRASPTSGENIKKSPAVLSPVVVSCRQVNPQSRVNRPKRQ